MALNLSGKEHDTDDADARFREFVRAQWPPLTRTAYLLTGDRGTAEVPLLATDTASGPDAYDRVADRDLVLGALRGLPKRTRAVLVLRYYEDLSEAATAEVLDCSVGTVKSLASRGLARLRRQLAPPSTPTVPSLQEDPV